MQFFEVTWPTISLENSRRNCAWWCYPTLLSNRLALRRRNYLHCGLISSDVCFFLWRCSCASTNSFERLAMVIVTAQNVTFETFHHFITAFAVYVLAVWFGNRCSPLEEMPNINRFDVNMSTHKCPTGVIRQNLVRQQENLVVGLTQTQSINFNLPKLVGYPQAQANLYRQAFMSLISGWGKTISTLLTLCSYGFNHLQYCYTWYSPQILPIWFVINQE